MTTYACKECGAPVEVTEEGVKRTCEHTDAAVVAHLEAQCTGDSAVQ